MIIAEKNSKSILSKSQIYDYVINPYVGCQHACSYCYAKFMKRFTGHKEAWGEFVDVKINAPELLINELSRKMKGTIWISGVCDPYQPIERKYRLTRKCLEILTNYDWPVVIQTRSPLVVRDIDLLKKLKILDVGLSITTADDAVRKIFEPKAPPINERIKALEELRKAGLHTYAMIAPILPGAENLIELLAGKIDSMIIDRMNYGGAGKIYKDHGWGDKISDKYFIETGKKISIDCKKNGIKCESVFS